jgi:hypothetical protein
VCVLQVDASAPQPMPVEFDHAGCAYCSVGTAGGFQARGGAIGDVYVGVAVMNHDRRIQIPVRLCGSGRLQKL